MSTEINADKILSAINSVTEALDRKYCKTPPKDVVHALSELYYYVDELDSLLVGLMLEEES